MYACMCVCVCVGGGEEGLGLRITTHLWHQVWAVFPQLLHAGERGGGGEGMFV